MLVVLYMFRFIGSYGNTRFPASVIRPLSSRSLHLSMFSCVQWLLGRRGDRRCARRPSGSRLSVLSIQPKQSASSTTST